ncbi:hypothetical protein ACFOEK_20205 [Litoribrevibacter euphylliae]|uniref:Uncharacterized protein n=1 Tax=Litoribrevibacter euphylliae TaxID=1834034 RepID=A0ABV7HHN6_9GAMM
MFTLLKEIFWEGAFKRDAVLLDRDRYLLGLMALIYFQTCLLLDNSLLMPPPDSLFFDEGDGPIISVYWALIRMDIFIDPIFLALHVLLAARAFGRWLGVPLGLISFIATIGSLRILLMSIQEFYGYSFPDEIVLALAIVSGIWLIPVLFMLFSPGLRENHPEHNLFTQNPNLAPDMQLTPVAFLHKMLILNVGVMVVMLLINILFAIFGSHASQEPMMILNLIISVGAMILSLWYAVKRLRNLGWSPLPWMLFLVIVPSLISALISWLYLEVYFYNVWIFIVVTFLAPVIKWAFMVIAFKVMLQPYKAPEKQLALEL